MSNISANLKYLRKKKGLTQQQFADNMEIKRSLIGAYEEDRAEPKYDLLKKIAEYFQDGFWLNASFDGAEWCLRQVNSSSKIIGNIYENPELISKTSTHEN